MDTLKKPNRYFCVKSLCKSEELGEYISYGIALEGDENLVFRDVSPDKNSVEVLAEKLNGNGLCPIHLRDVLEDFISAL